MIPVLAAIAISLATPLLVLAQESQRNPTLAPSDESSIRVTVDGPTVVLETASDHGARLLDLIEACEMVTGHRFVLGSIGFDERFVRLSQRHEVAKGHFFGFFQDCLRVLDLVLVSLPSTAGNASSRGYSIVATSGGAGNRPGFVKANAETLDLANLGEHSLDSAILYTVDVSLRHINAQELTNTLNAYMTDPMTESIRAIASSNSVVMTSFGSNLATLAELIARVDVPPAGDARSVEVIPLKYVFASELAPKAIEVLVPSRTSPMPNLPYSTAPSIAADERTNSIVVSGTAEHIASVKGFVAALDIEARDSVVSQVFSTPGGDGLEIAATLQTLYGKRETTGETGETAAVDPAIQFVATPAGDKLIARGPASRMKEIGELIAKLAIAK